MGAPSPAPHPRPVLSSDSQAHHLLLLAHPSSHLLFLYPPDFSFFLLPQPLWCGRNRADSIHLPQGWAHAVGGEGMEAQAMSWSGCTLLGPWFSGSSVLAGQLSSAPKSSSLGQRLGAVGRGSCGQGLTGLLFASFPSAAAASRPGAVFSVEGAPENRAGKCSLAAHLPCPPAGFPRPGYRSAKGHVFFCRPLRPRCRGH